MKTYNNLYEQIISPGNLMSAWRRARKHKTKKDYVKEFEKDTIKNLFQLHKELKNETYSPKPLKTFILRDPKTRKISKSDFRDRIVHHAIVNVLEPIFDKTFIYDSYANRKGKGNLKAVQRFQYFARKVSRNGKINGWFNNNQIKGYCLKADIKHYFQDVDHEILLNIIKRKINDEKVIRLITKILDNYENNSSLSLSLSLSLSRKIGMPLGNLTSQFFANVYLNELDYFVKHKLNAKYYIRYVDDFVILHSSKEQLNTWKEQINSFLRNELKIELHPEKSKIISLSKGIDFVGFRNFYFNKLLRTRNIRKMGWKIGLFNDNKISYEKFFEIFQGWYAYAKWADSNQLMGRLISNIKLPE